MRTRIRAKFVALQLLASRIALDERGVGAIEFAILVPVLMLLYLGALDTTNAMNVAKRATRAAGTVADIVTQQTGVSKSLLATMPSVATAIFAPTSTAGMAVKITGITIDSGSNATVTWSWAQDGTKPYKTGDPVTVPTDMKKASSFLVRTELSLPYTILSFGPDFMPTGMNSITIQRQYFYRQRTGSTISCSDCG